MLAGRVNFADERTEGTSSFIRDVTEFRNNTQGRGLCACAVGRSDHQLNTYDYLADVPRGGASYPLVEVQFKNTRKDYYRNELNLDLRKGDTVVVEAQAGHDVGVVTLTGPLVELQMKKARVRSDAGSRKVYRLAREIDMQRWEEAKAREHETMIEARAISQRMGLQMKIGDLEFQGDGGKAIFYYIADGRVDFRELIKVFAQSFGVRIEMKQIGARQEAGRIGGIGPCGRELCCATWMKNFSTVSTGSARKQDLSLNPQKLAGQCAKLKCCLNYEVDVYVDASRELPSHDLVLQTGEGDYTQVKVDVLAGRVTYSLDPHVLTGAVTISAERAREVRKMNMEGQKPPTLSGVSHGGSVRQVVDLASQESLTRFDNRGRKGRGGKMGRRKQQRRQSEPKEAHGYGGENKATQG